MQSRISASIELSPLLRQTEFNLAEDIVNSGLNTGNISDYHQQVLGIPSQVSINSLTLQHIEASLAAPPPQKTNKRIRLAGIDQGRGQHWIYISEFYLPHNYQNLPTQLVIDQTCQQVLVAKDVVVTEIPKLLEEYQVDFGLIDNEPDISQSSELSRLSVLELADQKSSQLTLTKKIVVRNGGINHNCWGINNEMFLKLVLNSFLNTDLEGYPLQRVPQNWEQWLNNRSELSPVRHLLGPKYDPDTNTWTRGEGNIDDLYYACMFQQASFYIWLTERVNNAYQPGLGTVRR